MAEHMRDRDDEMLSQLFASEPIADDGFSDAIVKRIRRRLWTERLVLPTAVVVGAALAFRPLTELVRVFVEFEPARRLVQAELPIASLSEILSGPNLLIGGLLLVAGIVAYELVED